MKGKRISVLLVAFMALLMIGACAKPPEAEKGAANAAKEKAVAAAADKYAKADFEEANKILDEAEAKMGGKKYDDAKKGYVAAKEAFEKAEGGVEAGKKAVADEVTAALASAGDAWKGVEAGAKKVAGKMAADLKTAWAEDAKKVEEALKGLKDLAGSDPAAAKDKLSEIKAAIEKWEGELKNIAAAPAAKAPKK